MKTIIETNNLSKSYGDDTLFTDLSIDFKAKEQLGLIGMNGSGKSTIIKILTGFLKPNSGKVELEGMSNRPRKQRPRTK